MQADRLREQSWQEAQFLVEILLEVMTEKVNLEVESTVSGMLIEIENPLDLNSRYDIELFINPKIPPNYS